MTFAPSLESLFFMLRNADIRVGVEEIARLAEVFALEPALDREGLRRVLRSVLLASEDESAAFERVYAMWLDTLEEQLEAVEHAAAAAAPTFMRTRSSRKRAVMAVVSLPDPAAGAPASAARPPAPMALPAGEQRAAVALDDTSLVGDDHEDPAPPPASRADEASRAEARPVESGPALERPMVAAASQHASPRARLLRLAVLGALLVLGGVVFGSRWLGDARHGSRELALGADAGAAGLESSHDAGPAVAPFQRAMLRVLQPEITVTPQPLPRTGWFGFFAAAGALGLIIWLWARFGRGTWLPDDDVVRASERADKAAPEQTTARPSLETLMLDERDEEELVWGVGRFVSQDLGRDLDIERTVRETASAYGRPVLVYQGTQYQREVWLWIDESVDSPVARQLADDLALMLEQSGLPVMRATFWGMPDRLRTSGDEVITVDAFDARRDSMAVAVLTDGRMMSLAHRARNRRGDVHELLRNLAFWPRVSFIDFGDGRLAPLCEGHGLRVIKPADAAGAISELAEPYQRPAEYDMLVGDARVWAAACSLSPYPVADREALALRRELMLDVSPWTVQRIREQARDGAGGIDFAVAQRASLLSWLVEAEDVRDKRGRLSRASLLARVVAAWDRVLERRRDTLIREAYKSGQVTLEDVGREQRELTRACIHLWTDPDRAVATLYRMHETGDAATRLEIERCLRPLGTRDEQGRDGVIALPWTLSQVRRETRVMLGELGFGRARAAHAEHLGMPAPGRVWLALGLSLGVFAGAVGALAHQQWFTEKPVPIVEELGVRPDNAYIQRTPLDRRTWRAEAGTPWAEPRAEYVKRGEQVALSWESISLPCIEKRDAVTIYRCPPNRATPGERPAERGFWSFAVIVSTYREQAETVAAELLESGSVDGVYLIASAQELADIPMANLARPRSQQPAGAWDQLLVVAPAAPELLEPYSGRAVVVDVDGIGELIGMTDDFEGWETLAERRPRLELRSGSAEDFRIRGMGPCGARDQRCCAEPLERCEGDLRCDGAMCTAGGCKLSDPDRCLDASTLEVCTDDGTWQKQACAANEVCDVERGACRLQTCDDIECKPSERCDPEALACVPTMCSGSESRCNAKGTAFRRCDAETGDWGRARRCLAGSLCSGKSPCQPIRHATIEFRSVELISNQPEADEEHYRIRCAASSIKRRIVTLRLSRKSSNSATVIAQGVIKLPYDESRRRIRLSCQTVYEGPPGKSRRLPVEGVLSGQASHEWNLEANGTHRMGLGRPGYTSTVTVSYSISLELGFVDRAPLDESEMNEPGGAGDSGQ